MFIVFDQIFLQVTFQICCYLGQLRELGNRDFYTPSDITNKYIYDAFLMIYLSIVLLLFFHFLVLQRS